MSGVAAIAGLPVPPRVPVRGIMSKQTIVAGAGAMPRHIHKLRHQIITEAKRIAVTTKVTYRQGHAHAAEYFVTQAIRNADNEQVVKDIGIAMIAGFFDYRERYYPKPKKRR
jgi:urease alpha subunit